jgi:hypothetical protein
MGGDHEFSAVDGLRSRHSEALRLAMAPRGGPVAGVIFHSAIDIQSPVDYEDRYRNRRAVA